MIGYIIDELEGNDVQNVFQVFKFPELVHFFNKRLQQLDVNSLSVHKARFKKKKRALTRISDL